MRWAGYAGYASNIDIEAFMRKVASEEKIKKRHYDLWENDGDGMGGSRKLYSRVIIISFSTKGYRAFLQSYASSNPI